MKRMVFLIMSEDGDGVFGEGVEGGEPRGGSAGEGDEEPGDGGESEGGGFGDEKDEGGGEESDEGGTGKNKSGDFEVADANGAEGSDFGESFADVGEGEVSESEEGSGGDEGGEDGGEAGAFGAGGLAAFEDGLCGLACAVTGFIASFGADHGGRAEFDDLDVGEDAGNFGADFAEAVDAGAVAAESEDGVDLVFETEEFLGFVEVDPGGAIVAEITGRVGLGDGIGLAVEGEGIVFFEAEGIVEIVSEVDGAGSEGAHDGFLFRAVGDGHLSFDSDEEDGAVFFLPLDAAGELREEVVDGHDFAFGEFVDGVLRHGFFGVSAFLDLPEFFASGEEEDVEAETFHGLADVVLE